MKTLGRELNQAITGQFRVGASDPAPVHIVVPDSTTADSLVSIADSVAGKELSRLRWERDNLQGRPALTYNGELAAIPPRLPEKDRVAVSFLLEQDRWKVFFRDRWSGRLIKQVETYAASGARAQPLTQNINDAIGKIGHGVTALNIAVDIYDALQGDDDAKI